MASKNTNCLEGYACPECGNTAPLLIRCRSWHLFYDDGTDDDGKFDEEIEYDNDSEVICYERGGGCGHRGAMRDFHIVNHKKENDE